MNKFGQANAVKREDKRRAKLRRQGLLPPPPHVFPHVRRSNSWQARYRLQQSKKA